MSTLIFMLVAGAIAYNRIPKEAEPDINIPNINVSTTLEGVSPVDAERLLVRPLEEEFKNLEAVKQISASAFQGGATISIEFEPGTNTDMVLQEVRNKVDMARPQMPAEMEEPKVFEVNMSLFPMMIITLSGNFDERLLLYYARAFRDEVKILPGVLNAEIAGNREEVVEIIIDPARAASYRLNSDDLGQIFARANRLVAAGRIDTGRGSFSITVPGLFENIDDILNMPVKSQGNAVVRVRDIADIKRTFKDRDSFVRVNGDPAVAIEITKRSGANLILTANNVRRSIERAKADWPTALKVGVTQDKAQRIKIQIEGLQNSILLAIFLVMASVIAALGPRSGFLVGLAIPGAFLMGILFLFMSGLTMNSIVMFGLILSVGMLVDGAIVVTEYADRKMTEGLDRKEAYVMAAQRMAWPIITSTATTIAAFVPLLMWPGLMGQMMVYMPITLICVLTGSLLMALVFVPSLGRLIGRPSEADRGTMTALSGEDRVDIEKLRGATKTYVRVLSLALQHPGKILLGIVILLVTVPALYLWTMPGAVFFPDGEVDRATLLIHGRGNLAIKEKDMLIREVEQRIAEIPDFRSVYSRTGASGQGAASDVIGQITVNFKAWKERRPKNEILKDITARTADLVGIRVEPQIQRHGFGSNKPIEIEINSAYPHLLIEALDHIREAMRTLSGFSATEDSRPLPGIEWRLEVDRAQAARFGIDLASVGSAVRLITNGVKLGTFRPDDSQEEVDILVRYPKTFRSISQLDKLRIDTPGGLIPISNFVKRIPVQQETQLRRINGRRIMTISSDVKSGILASQKVAELKAWLKENPVDPRVRVSFKGDDLDQRESGAFLFTAFATGLFLMAAILLIQFNSFYAVLLILSSVILSTIGVLLGYIITGSPFNIVMSGIGLIALAGIVVNNNIVLIDTYVRLVKTAPSVFDAIIQTGAQRLRPVFLTTLTTVLGLLPMANSLSINFFTRRVTINDPSTMWWQQLAFTIICGLIFATVLTLIVTPSALMWKDQRRKEPKIETAAKPKKGSGIQVPAE